MKKWVLVLCIAFNTLAMTGLTFYFMKLPWLAGDEKFLIWATTALQFANRDRPDSEAFAFINTSYDLQLIDHYDDFGFPVGNQVITDRQKLTDLLSAINQSAKKPKYVIIDIHFVDPTASDSALSAELGRMNNVILSAHINENDQLEPPIFKDIPYGISDYLVGSAFDGVYKYQLIYNDSLKLLPLKVHEAIMQYDASLQGPFIQTLNSWTLNNFIMNYRILQKDISDVEAGFNPVSLGELLFLADEDISDFVGGKIVVIGDFFENDMHETVLEITAGPLILLNAYLSLANNDTRVNLWFFLLLILVYGYLSYLAFVDGDIIEKKINRFASKKITRYLAGFASYFFILTLFSLVTFLFFNIHINVFFIAVVFYMVDQVVGWIFYQKNKSVDT